MLSALVTEEVLLDLVENIGCDWQLFAMGFLNLQKHEIERSWKIFNKSNSSDAGEYKAELLSQWYEASKYFNTPEDLLESLRSASDKGYNTLAAIDCLIQWHPHLEVGSLYTQYMYKR